MEIARLGGVAPVDGCILTDASRLGDWTSANASQAFAAPCWQASREKDKTDWIQAGQALVARRNPCRWSVGDWLLFGIERFGVRYAEAGVVSGYDVQTLRNGVYVALRFEPARRRPTVSWSHHAALAGLMVDIQEWWLDRIERERLPLRLLREAVRGQQRRVASQGIAPPLTPGGPLSGMRHTSDATKTDQR